MFSVYDYFGASRPPPADLRSPGVNVYIKQVFLVTPGKYARVNACLEVKCYVAFHHSRYTEV